MADGKTKDYNKRQHSTDILAFSFFVITLSVFNVSQYLIFAIFSEK